MAQWGQTASGARKIHHGDLLCAVCDRIVYLYDALHPLSRKNWVGPSCNVIVTIPCGSRMLKNCRPILYLQNFIAIGVVFLLGQRGVPKNWIRWFPLSYGRTRPCIK